MSGSANRIINMTPNEFIEVGKRISACRRAAGMTLDDVGQMLGMHRSSILRYENGHTKQIKLVVLERIAQIFHTTPEYLMTGSTQPVADTTEEQIASKQEAAPENEILSENNAAPEETPAELSEKMPPILDPPHALSFGDDDDFKKKKLSVRSPFKYEVHVPPSTIYSDHDIISSLIENTLPHVFAYMNYSKDFSPRILPGDILTVRTTDQADSGDLCLLMTRDRAVVLRRLFHTHFGVTLVSENPEIPPESLACLGRNSGFTMIGRVTHLNVTL